MKHNKYNNYNYSHLGFSSLGIHPFYYEVIVSKLKHTY